MQNYVVEDLRQKLRLVFFGEDLNLVAHQLSCLVSFTGQLSTFYVSVPLVFSVAHTVRQLSLSCFHLE